MRAELPTLDHLPRQSASHVKNKWRDVVREVRTTGSIAITNHSAVELVLVDAATYEQLAASAAALSGTLETIPADSPVHVSHLLRGKSSPPAFLLLALGVFGYLLRHRYLWAALTPLVTMTGLDFATLLAGTVFTEQIFDIDGIGSWALDAVKAPQDFPVILATVLVSAVLIVVANLVVDVVYGFLDPRVRVS